MKWARRRPAIASLAVFGAAAFMGLVVLAGAWWHQFWKAAEAVRDKETLQRDLAELDSEKQQTHQELHRLGEEAAAKRSEFQQLQDKVRKETVAFRRIRYGHDIHLAGAFGDMGDIKNMLSLLEGQRPSPGEEDLRGFEWYYLHRFANAARVTLNGHNQGVSAIAYSPDGRELAAGESDGTVRVWDLVTGRELTRPPGAFLAGSSLGIPPRR
jgi:hypothetical protein